MEQGCSLLSEGEKKQRGMLGYDDGHIIHDDQVSNSYDSLCSGLS